LESHGVTAVAFFSLEKTMEHPYETLNHLLREYKHLCDMCDATGALECAMQIRRVASELVVLAAQNAEPTLGQ
jgi:hypothetical protein